jgi:hypothetical protein
LTIDVDLTNRTIDLARRRSNASANEKADDEGLAITVGAING